MLDVGRLVFEGSPAEVKSNDLVRSAYLGSAVGTDEEDGSATDPVGAGVSGRTLDGDGDGAESALTQRKGT